MSGDIGKVQRHVAARAVFTDDRMIDRMPCRPTLIGDGKLRSAHTVLHPALFA
jgi:hypothetical protein